MNLVTGESSDEFFGGAVPPHVRHLIDDARQEPNPARALALLWTAQVCAPDCPSLYYLLYKFHARHGDIKQAEFAALKGLEVAAMQAGLPLQWQDVHDGMSDFQQPGPARFWLFTLKALAFLRLRQRDPFGARGYLRKVLELDPTGGTGAGVIDALLKEAT